MDITGFIVLVAATAVGVFVGILFALPLFILIKRD